MKIVMICPFKLGDALLTFPILVALRVKYSDVHITFVGNPAVLPLAQAWSIAEEVREFDKHWDRLFSDDIIHRSKVRNVLQQTDLALGWPTTFASMVRQNLLNAGARRVIILEPPEGEKTHVVEHLAVSVGVPPVRPENIILSNTGLTGAYLDNPPIALHPGCAEYRRWPATSFSTLIDSLVRSGHSILLLGGPTEVELLKTIQRNLSTSPGEGLLTVLNDAPLLEVARCLKQCGCFVGHDTGTSHLAGLLRIPTLVLFGPSSPALWRPLGPTVEVIQKEPLSQLPVAIVLEHILHAYNSHQRK